MHIFEDTNRTTGVGFRESRVYHLFPDGDARHRCLKKLQSPGHPFPRPAKGIGFA